MVNWTEEEKGTITWGETDLSEMTFTMMGELTFIDLGEQTFDTWFGKYSSPAYDEETKGTVTHDEETKGTISYTEETKGTISWTEE